MSRPLRIEFPGALYHVTSRGDRREPIFIDDGDRLSMLSVVEQAMSRFEAQAPAYCLMGNHYHLVLRTRQANLSRLMRHLNGVTTQDFNRRHGKVGHLFQGRFKAILVDRESYLLEVCRYVELNPVRAGIVAEPGAWPWSSYRSHIGQADPAPWFDTAGLHGFLLGRDVQTAAGRRQAGARYAEWVSAGRDVPLWDRALRQQIYLGDERFVERMQALAAPPGPASARSAREVPMAQRRRVMTLQQWLAEGPTREQALWRAHVQGGFTMSAMAQELGLSVSRVSRLIARAEAAAPSGGRGKSGSASRQDGPPRQTVGEELA